MTLNSILGRRLLTAVLVLFCASSAFAADQDVDPPYFCGSKVEPTNLVDRTICADKSLQVLYSALDYDLEDAMTQAVQANKSQLLDKFKNEQAAWEEKRGTTCSDAGTASACLRSAYENRRREVAAELTAEGLKPVSAQARDAATAEASRDATAGATTEAPQASVAPQHRAPLIASASTASPKPVESSDAEDTTHLANAIWVFVAFMVGLIWWASSRKKKAGIPPATTAAPTQPIPVKKNKWGWGIAIVLVLIMLSKHSEHASTNKETNNQEERQANIDEKYKSLHENAEEVLLDYILASGKGMCGTFENATFGNVRYGTAVFQHAEFEPAITGSYTGDCVYYVEGYKHVEHQTWWFNMTMEKKTGQREGNILGDQQRINQGLAQIRFTPSTD